MRKWHYCVITISLILLTSVLLTGKTALAQVPPTVDTNPAGNVTSTSATLNGNLTSLGDYSWADVSFEWGGNISYGNETTPPGNLSIAGTFAASIGNLSPSTTYHFRAKAVGNSSATPAYGGDVTFTTGLLPTVITNPASNVTSSSATLTGNLTSLGNTTPPVSVSFEWGLTDGYGNETPPGNLSAPAVFSADLTGLDANTTYHFRAKAVGSTVYGSDMAFTTALTFNLEGWGWCTDYNTVVPVTFDGYTTMVERTGAANSFSMHAVGNLTLPAPYSETIPLDMYGSRVRSLFYLRQEVTGLSVSFYGTWLSGGNETYAAMSGEIALPNPGGTSLKTAKICSVFLRTPGGQVPLTEPGTFVQDLDSMLSRFVKFIDSVVTALIGTGFSGILSSTLAKLAVLAANLRGLGIPYIP